MSRIDSGWIFDIAVLPEGHHVDGVAGRPVLPAHDKHFTIIQNIAKLRFFGDFFCCCRFWNKNPVNDNQNFRNIVFWFPNKLLYKEIKGK